jgi:hypothetical protein
MFFVPRLNKRFRHPFPNAPEDAFVRRIVAEKVTDPFFILDEKGALTWQGSRGSRRHYKARTP